MTNGEALATGKNEIFTGNGMDFSGNSRSGDTAQGGEFRSAPLSNAARNDYQFIGQRHQNSPENSAERQRQEDKYGYDTVVVGGKRPREGQDRTSTLGSAGGKMGGGTNEESEGHQGHVADMAAISGDTLPTSQGYALDSGEINMDDDMGEGTGREGSEEVPPGEGARVLKTNVDEGQGQASTWSETKTKAGKERKRLPLACIACRRKKIRCSGEKPTCRHCLRSRTPCVYKQSTRKAAPRTDYMAMLDRRLKRMEERLIKSMPKEDVSAVLAVTGRSVVKPSLSTSNARSASSGKKRTAGTAFGGELDAWARSENPTKHRNGNAGLGVWGDSLKGGQGEMDDGSRALPSKEIQEHLAEVFFEFIYGQPYLLLHKPSFMRRLRSGTAPPVLVLALCAVSARFSKHPAVRHDPPFLAGECFAAEARRLLLKNFDNPNITNVTVCIMLGLHEFGTCQGGRSWAFGGMATRMAHALQLHKEVNNDPIGKSSTTLRSYYPQDHEGPLGINSMSFVDREIRRRCMWASFAMDRFNSSGTERPCIISESELGIQLPSHDKNLEFDLPTITEQLDGNVLGSPEPSHATENMGVGAYIVRVIALYGRVVKYVNQGNPSSRDLTGGTGRESRRVWDPNSQFAELCANIDDFENTLPERLRYTPENAQSHVTAHLFSQFIFVHVAFHQVRLFLQKSTIPATPTDTPDMPREFAQSASELTLTSATQIAKILEDVEERGAVVAAPFLGYCAFSAALIHLAQMSPTHNSVQMEAKRYMEVCLRFLLQLRQYWGLFCYITDNLKRLYRKFSDAVAKGSSFSGHQETARMLQYGDWFQKYPRGVSANEYERNAEKPQHDYNSSPDNAVLSQPSNLQTAEEFFARLGSRSQRSAPSVAPSKRPTQPLVRVSPANTSTIIHGSSPAPAHHSQSPAIYHSPAMRQSPTTEVAPSTIPTPPMTSGRGNIDLKLDPQLLNPPMFSRPPVVSSVSFEQTTQHHSSISSLLPNIPSPVSFSNYPVTMSRASAADVSSIPTGMHQPHHHHQDYYYGLYPPGESDPSATVGAATHSLNNGLWPFDPSINLSLADTNAFPDQTSSAWFLPFNSCPPDFGTRVEGMGHLSMMSGERGDGEGDGDESGGDGGNRGGVPHMISPAGGRAGPSAPSGATAYHDGVR